MQNSSPFVIATLSYVRQNLFAMTRKFKQWWQEEFEDTKGSIRIRILKTDRQHNSTNINKTNNHLSSEMNSLKAQRLRHGLCQCQCHSLYNSTDRWFSFYPWSIKMNAGYFFLVIRSCVPIQLACTNRWFSFHPW